MAGAGDLAALWAAYRHPRMEIFVGCFHDPLRAGIAINVRSPGYYTRSEKDRIGKAVSESGIGSAEAEAILLSAGARVVMLPEGKALAV